MTLPAGARLGPYEILSPLGAGGMGEVYRARDTRLERTVAVKVLSPAAIADPDRRSRFELEAKAAGALNHPNLLAVYDLGSHEGAPFVVSEQLEGQTLRERLNAGDITPRKAVEYAVQVARGLAAAHERGIVHRDIKPENVFVCRDGTVKILDFGVAKLMGDADGNESETTSRLTLPGTRVGTIAYMSPEQVRGDKVDARSDIFSLGVVLYEMLARQRPFRGETAADLQVAIMREEPGELPVTDGRVSAAVDRIVRRCLEKRPEERFDTARDLALSLEAVTGSTGASTTLPGPTSRGPWPGRVAVAAGAIAAAGLGFLLARQVGVPAEPPSYTQLTFRRGAILGARFAPDGETVVYSAAWNGEPARIYTTRLGSRESRDLGIEGVVLAVSAKGEMALKLQRVYGEVRRGTLARASLAGGAPREILADVRDADWDDDGRELAVIHVVEERSQVEYPIGHVLYRCAGEAVKIRVLPSGSIAVFETLPDGGARPFALSIIGRDGSRRVLSAGWTDWHSIAWSPKSRETLFSGSTGSESALYGASPSGRTRLLARVPGDFILHDCDRRGRILLERAFPRGGVPALPPGEKQERDLAWLDFSTAVDLSADGRQILIGDSGGGRGGEGTIFIRSTDGAPAVDLGAGAPLSLSPDGRFVLALPGNREGVDHLLVVPTGVGQRQELRHVSVPRLFDAAWCPDGRHIVALAGENVRRNRLYYWGLEPPEAPRPISPEGNFGHPVVAPDGRWVAAVRIGTPLALYPVDGSTPRALPGADAEDQPLVWSADGRSLFMRRGFGMPARLQRLDVMSGARRDWKDLLPADPAGVFDISSVVLTPGGTSYAYSIESRIGVLYLAEGLE